MKTAISGLSVTTPLDRLRATANAPRPQLVCYLPVGDPKTAAATAIRYAEHGVDVIEAGIAVSEPLLDGPDVTASMDRARSAGVDGAVAAATLAAQLRTAPGVAAVWMSYRSRPEDDYLAMVASTGVGGLLLPDADPADLDDQARAHDLRGVPFLSHHPDRAQVRMALAAESYVMVAADGGQTGVRESVGTDNGRLLADLRTAGVSVRMLLGFGISGYDQVRAALELGADGVVVGSACIRAARAGLPELSRLLAELRGALDA